MNDYFNQTNQISLSKKNEKISNKSQLFIDEHEFCMWGDESSNRDASRAPFTNMV